MKKIYTFLLMTLASVSAFAQCSVTETHTVDGMTVTVNSDGTGATQPMTIITWDNGGANPVNVEATSGSYTFTANGTYEICVLYTDLANAQCAESACFQVTLPFVANACTIALTTTASGLSAFAVETHSGASGANEEVVINWGDGTTEPMNAQHLYAAPGTYTVCVTYTDLDNPTCTDTDCQVVTVTETSACSVDFTYGMSGNVCTFAATGSGAGQPFYAVNWGDGSAVQLQSSGSHTYAGPGDYLVCVTYSDAMAPTTCNDTQCYTVAVAASVSEQANKASHLTINPNPVGELAIISLEVNKPSSVDVAVYDLLGKRVEGLYQGTQSQGPNRLQYDASNLAAGVYFVKAIVNGEMNTIKFVKK